MTYSVKEIFLTLQGEGVQAGRRSVFLRFSGCNLWSGREADRATAICRFCDTDFVGTDGVGGGKFSSALELAQAVATCWGEQPSSRYVVITGGEPMLQLDQALVEALHALGFEIGVESNGTLPAVKGIDWLCISPKAGSDVVQRSGDELKLIWPQSGSDWQAMEHWDFRHHLIQPLDDPNSDDHRAKAIAFVMENPQWRLTTQVHKALNLP
jgi:7-carboxy-7-deazaguanine synthase